MVYGEIDMMGIHEMVSQVAELEQGGWMKEGTVVSAS